MLSIGCSSTGLLLKLLLIYGSGFVSSSSSSLRLPPSVHFLGETSLRFHPVPFHAAVCCQARGSYIVPGATFCWGRYGGTHLEYGQLPRVHIKLPWGHPSTAGWLAECNEKKKNIYMQTKNTHMNKYIYIYSKKNIHAYCEEMCEHKHIYIYTYIYLFIPKNSIHAYCEEMCEYINVYIYIYNMYICKYIYIYI